jgi:hypothetical protein
LTGTPLVSCRLPVAPAGVTCRPSVHQGRRVGARAGEGGSSAPSRRARSLSWLAATRAAERWRSWPLSPVAAPQVIRVTGRTKILHGLGEVSPGQFGDVLRLAPLSFSGVCDTTVAEDVRWPRRSTHVAKCLASQRTISVYNGSELEIALARRGAPPPPKCSDLRVVPTWRA